MKYARNNLYVGAYEVPEHGWLALDDAQWRVERCDIYTEGLAVDSDGQQLALILEDEGKHFWPVISLLSLDEAETLYRQLQVRVAELRFKRRGS